MQNAEVQKRLCVSRSDKRVEVPRDVSNYQEAVRLFVCLSSNLVGVNG